jgi:uridine kinase
MKQIILVSGSLRSFKENLQYWPPYDIAVYVSRDDNDTYLNKETYQFLFEDSRIKYIFIERSPEIPSIYKEEREQNVYKQWYKCYRLFQCIPSTYDWYIRIRPDVRLTNSFELQTILDKPQDSIYIPSGNDRLGINDQIACGSYQTMHHYMNLWKTILNYPNLTSEEMLQKHLEGIPIQRFKLQYTLVLSSAKVIAIAGDSGSGKSTFIELIRPFFLFDKVLEFETDRYHKWERGNERWKHISHLNPEANYLEKLEEDTFNLKLGNVVVSVDYDHTTGKFTHPKTVEPKENIILCGLHTFYSKQLRNLSDLKIYIDTSEELKTKWKIQRDVHQRGHSKENVLSAIQFRKSDYETYVSPQKEHADIIVQLDSNSLVLQYQTNLSYQWVHEFTCQVQKNTITFSDPSIDVRNAIHRFIVAIDLPSVEGKIGFNGVLQLMFLRALYG